MITIENVSKQVENKWLLNDVSFKVDEGACIGLIGPNGAGKSTLMKLLSGLEEPTSGTVKVLGKEAGKWSVKKLAQKVSVLTQDGLSPYPMTVYDAVLMGRYPHLSFFQREGTEDYKRVENVLSMTGLDSFRNQMLDTLSGGERQRVAIAKAMVQEPEVLLLDEPTSYLDIGYQVNVLNLVKEWQNRDQLTVLMVLHDLNLAAQYCDQLVLMNNGEVIKQGTSEEIIEADTLQTVYQTKPEIIRHPKSNIPQILL
ncbi:ABC transporter ATP-binding protein [Alkalibacillus haloalkaliphilus]|uniref:ABC transporter ATP-binding protein n=1 Tax=Alkalibacillus haloalkaliphilus TaxID=94136 RepID=A0A511W9W4_9BACI|nr:ABC transporter ATP-binding protein [Alkalibacillus haloalkaliphilus]MDV2583037.1 ABC transporter ATP-binding protein [Alkalibacillus haloalkaliphilus]GEN46122.1 ABC transporter ATP-binding protein [Alkalibacillus haloalkaliphilus]